MPLRLGLHSPKLDAVAKLRTKAGRAEQCRYAIEGATLLDEALRVGLEPEAIYVTECGLAALDRLPGEVAARALLVPERAFARLSDVETPSGVLAVLPLALLPVEELLRDGAPALVLAGVSDPGNAGALLRSAEIFGIRAVVFGAGGVEPHAPKVVRASMGAFFRLRLASATAEDVLATARDAAYTIVAADRSGTALPEFVFPERPLIAIGNERHGVGGWLPRWDRAVSIPQPGAGESLNAAVAGGIIFYAFSQRDARTARP